MKLAASGALVSAFLLAAIRTTTTEAAGTNLDNYCKLAQNVIANGLTSSDDLDPTIQLYTNVTEFVSSDAYPWGRKPDNLTLIVPQYVGYAGADTDKPSESSYAQTVMCKMKSSDALNKYYGAGTATGGNTCSTVNQRIVADVLEQEQKEAVKQECSVPPVPNIVYDDWKTLTGSQWSGNSPAVTAYLSKEDGNIHVVGKELYVSVNNLWFPLRSKVGVHYCQTIAPEYVRRIVSKEVVPPTCPPPPTYKYFFSKKQWNCANPNLSPLSEEMNVKET